MKQIPLISQLNKIQWQLNLISSNELKKKYYPLIFTFLFFISILHAQNSPNIIWQKTLGGTSDDYAYSIQQIADGGFIVAGNSYSNDGDVLGNHGYGDYWIVKLDSLGIIKWKKTLGGTNVDVAYSIQQASDEGFIVAGYSYSNDGDVSGNHGGFGDYWIVKLDDAGNIEWQKALGGTNADVGRSIQQTTDGGFIVAGSSSSLNGDVTGNHGEEDYWVVKLNSSGLIEWQKSLGGTGADVARLIRQTSDGGYVVTGYSYSNNGNVTGHHGDNTTSDYWVVKLNSSGSIEWQKSLGGTVDDDARSVQPTDDGGFIVAGGSSSNDGNVTGNHGYNDYWVVKLNSSGSLEWQTSLGGTGDDYSLSIQQSSDGGFLAAGYSSSDDGDVSGNIGYYDYWIVKLNSPGNLEWQKSLGGTDYDAAWSIQQTADGGSIAAGYTASLDGDVSGQHDDSTGTFDYWIVKLSAENDLCEDLEVTINPEGSLDICDAGFVDLIASEGSNFNYQWNRNTFDIPGATNQIFHAKRTGNYRVRVVDDAGCHGVSKKKTVYSSCKLSEEDEIASSLNLFPNPTTGTFTLDLKLNDEENSQAIIQVLNMLGQMVYDETTSVANGVLQKEIQLSGEAAEGMYLVRVTIKDCLYLSQINLQK